MECASPKRSHKHPNDSPHTRPGKRHFSCDLHTEAKLDAERHAELDTELDAPRTPACKRPPTDPPPLKPVNRHVKRVHRMPCMS